MSLGARPEAASSLPVRGGMALGRLVASAFGLARPHALSLLAISAIALVPIYALDYFDGVRAGTYDSLAAAATHARHALGIPNVATLAKYLISLVLAPLQTLAAIAALAQARARGRTSIASAYESAAPHFFAAVGAGFRYSTPLAGGFFLALIGLGLVALGGAFALAGVPLLLAGFALFSVAGFAFTLALVHLVVEGKNPGHWFGLARRVLARPDLRWPTLAVIALFPLTLGVALGLDTLAAYYAALAIHSRIAYEALRLLAMASLSAFGNVSTFVYDEDLRARGVLAPAGGIA